jgi:hypothetical protein
MYPFALSPPYHPPEDSSDAKLVFALSKSPFGIRYRLGSASVVDIPRMQKCFFMSSVPTAASLRYPPAILNGLNASFGGDRPLLSLPHKCFLFIHLFGAPRAASTSKPWPLDRQNLQFRHLPASPLIGSSFHFSMSATRSLQ